MTVYSKIVNKGLIIALVLFSLSSGKVCAIENREEVWTDVGASKSWDNWDVSLTMGNYFVNSGWYLVNGEMQLKRSIWKAWSLGMGYKQEYTQWEGNLLVEYRPMANLFYKVKMGPLSLRNRARMEFRYFEQASATRFRNQLKATYKGRGDLVPYLSTEVFMNSTPLEYTRNRSYLGTQWKVNNLAIDLYACWQVTKLPQPSWFHLFVLGTGLYIDI
jgi:hypothetical protein